MAVITRYVVEHKGVEKFVTADKKEADQYDKMLDVADNLSEYIEGKGIKIDVSVLEELSIMLQDKTEYAITDPDERKRNALRNMDTMAKLQNAQRL